MTKATFAKRLFAFIIDIPAMYILSYLIAFGFAILTAPLVGRDSALAQMIQRLLNVIAGALFLVFGFFYFGFFWSRSGQSIGMKLMTIRVVRESGERVGFFRSGLRGSVGYAISGLVFFLGFIWALFDKDGEAWHDKIFDTRVIEHQVDPYANYSFPDQRTPPAA